MKEYKREKSDLEKSVKALEEQSKHYKDNLRLVDAWWKQVCSLAALNMPMLMSLGH
jgi:E3 ubiquitin-protein ligase BRE1